MRDVHNILPACVVAAVFVVIVLWALLALKNAIDRDAREAADIERRAWQGLRRATRGLAEATQDFREAVGDNVAAKQRHREILGAVGADIVDLDARRRRH